MVLMLTLRERWPRAGCTDQLGGGFHRYSVDEQWFVPHFEKMLYDQAQLAVSYLEAFQITRETLYADVARDIFEYVLRDLAHAEGGFYSAEDADSATDPARPKEKHEGAFYVWTHKELVEALGPADAAIFCERFGVEERGNVQEDPHGEFIGTNILYEARSVEVPRKSLETLMHIRSARPRPHLDDKVLAGWNGMMISAFAKGAQILGEPRYEQAARRALDFLRRELWRESDSVLLRRYRDGEAAIEGFLDDYAFLALALLDMYETSFQAADLEWAGQLVRRATELFDDPQAGGFFSTAAEKAELVLRLKDDYDGAEPSGNSGLALALLRLARLTGREEYEREARRTLRAFSPRLHGAPSALPQLLVALSFALGRPMEIVLAGPNDPEMLAAIRRHFLPNAVVMRSENSPVKMPAVDAGPTAYVCENYTCKLPVTSAASLEDLLQ